MVAPEGAAVGVGPADGRRDGLAGAGGVAERGGGANDEVRALRLELGEGVHVGRRGGSQSLQHLPTSFAPFLRISCCSYSFTEIFCRTGGARKTYKKKQVQRRNQMEEDAEESLKRRGAK